jgi:hypothetical protein
VGFQSRSVALAALFGAVIAVSKIVIPSPIDKAVVIVQVVFLALSHLLLGSFGATSVALVSGVITAIWRASNALFTLTFALSYGLLIDGLSLALKVKTTEGEVETRKLMVAMTISTAFVGLISYYVTVYLLALLPRNPVIEAGILIAGIMNGVGGGYLAAVIWKKTSLRRWGIAT